MALVDVYGFDFNGATGIRAYKEVTTPAKNTTIYLKYKHQTNQTNTNYLIWSYSTTNGFLTPYFHIRMQNNQLYFYAENGFTNSSLGSNLVVSEVYEICITIGVLYTTLYINGVKITENTGLNTASTNWTFQKDSNIRFGGFYNNTSYSVQSIADFTLYNEALTNEEAINITSGSFNSTDTRIVFYESFNQVTLGTIQGTEQYAVIEQVEVPDNIPYSKLNLYIEPFKYNTDFVYKNKTVAGNNSIPQWPFDDEAENRLNDEYVLVKSTDIMTINNIKSLGYDSVIDTNVFRLHIESGLSDDIDLYGLYEDGSFEVIQTLSTVGFVENQYFDVDLNGITNLAKLAFIEPSTGFRLYLDSDLDVKCWEIGTEINVEGINVSVETNIKSYITLANTVFTNKINKTLFAYTSELVLTHNEFLQLNDFINTARKYRRKVLVNIDVNENLGNRILGIPDVSNTDFALSDLQIIETTGIYKYVTITYYNDEYNKVR